MDISVTTFNMAKKRNLEITIERPENDYLLCFWELENDCEWMFSYLMGSSELTFNKNVYLDKSIKEELPATIFSEEQLREVIKFVAKEINSQKGQVK